MAYERICTREEVWQGEMAGFESRDGTRLLVTVLDGGEIRAFQQECPHQAFSLLHAKLDRHVLTCRAHRWRFDIRTGRGINPGNCSLTMYPTRREGADILVDVAGSGVS